MFASGDLSHWLIVDKDEIIGKTGEKYYANAGVRVVISSISCNSYVAAWYRRSGELADPWVSIRSHGDPNGQLMVYGGNSAPHHNAILSNSGGMNVYIRNVPPCFPSNVMGDFGSKYLFAFLNLSNVSLKKHCLTLGD